MRRTPRQARARERMERVLDAAETVFADVGYAAATTNQIAGQANVPVGSVYDFFANKQAIAQALAVRYVTGLEALYQAGTGDDIHRIGLVLTGTVDALDGLICRHPGLGSLLRAHRTAGVDDSLSRDVNTGLTDHLDRILAARRPSADPARRRTVATMSALLVRFTLEQLADTSADNRPALIAEMKLALTAYLAQALPRP